MAEHLGRPDWNATVGRIALELGPAHAQAMGEAYLETAERTATARGARDLRSRWFRALGHTLLDEATSARLVLEELEADGQHGEWAGPEELDRLVDEDLAQLRDELEHPDGHGG